MNHNHPVNGMITFPRYQGPLAWYVGNGTKLAYSSLDRPWHEELKRIQDSYYSRWQNLYYA